MKLKHLLTVIILIITAQAYAQTGRPVSGVVRDSTGTTIPGATIKLLTGKDSTTVATDMNGKFSFPSVPVNQFSLVVFSVGYQPIKRRFVLNNDKTAAELAPIVLKSDAIALKGVVISDVNAVKIKEDTVEYNAAPYKVRQGAAVEDVIKKLPGVDVDKDGNITAQGKSVSKVRLNGKDYMAGDVTSLTKNLPADLVQNIQVVDDYGDQANITGIKTGDPQKVLNINIKQDKNYGYFGQATVGGGRDAIPQTHGSTDDDRYIASANVFSFNGNRQIAVSGNLNNTNTNLFNFGGGGGRGGPGGPPPGFGGSTNGITTARSFGLNYRDSWGKHVTAYGSYSFSNNSVNTITNSIQNNISPDNPTTNNTNTNENDGKLNHRFNFNIEWKPDTVNYFKITPSYSYASVLTNETQTSDLFASNTGITQSKYTLDLISHSTAPNYGLNVLYNHRFSTRGRNFSVLLTSGSTKNNQYQNPVYDYLPGSKITAPADQRINTDSRTDSVGAALSYMEPLSKLSFLEFNYGYHYANTTADKTTDTLADNGNINRYDLLSNDYKFQYITNRFGLNYRFIDKQYNYTLGVSAQPTLLQGSSLESAPTHITTFNVSPVARFVYNFSRSQALTINYNGSSNSPTYSELQPVTDYSTASYPVQGNPDLKPEYNNTFSIRYNKFDFASGNVFFSNMNFTATNDKIVAKTVTYPRNYPVKNLAGTILTQYQNADGYYSASAFYLYAKPWQKRKYTLFINGNISYTNNISYLGSVDTVNFLETDQKNMAKNLVLTQGARFRVDITDVIDATANASYSINHSINSVPQANVNNNYRTINLGVSGKNYLWKDWTVSYDYTKTLYEGYTGATNPNILNAYIERRFLKGNVGTLRFAVNDIFNENTAYTSTQNGSYINQSNVNRLGRYYMLTFTLRLQKFAGKSPMGPGPGGPGFRPGGGPGPGGPPPGGGMD
ncbi:TonB-dependent receptor [Mucilaginibacter sp. BT774]|uniref:TonB-dependent receptor n=1 Tax=Mucilaginibacter sp. BT774 TaxID=3062276 RepID=UPI002675F7B5|nr:outer membrane beta-barrel protein [Mucilaginibacter sp. BT774]MDO3624810.1 outer membrane beta-barrel protein [Mucilaginibacter sp. BT774]